ncbi:MULTISPECIES: alanine--tRNA ligase [unclassified Sedimentibacter]|uniref:alanine--tRNA ligase n=1 Tax=unclassified Sedimentibacter TaxID=2649220 RepID=UPI0027E118D9|nr:alanine--tRNA ligase [Sedimentibacter sp. MB35-C1]WMJ77131.1 alanine--tRNA ligase [Sedimentibacter sp. MB35-C1]
MKANELRELYVSYYKKRRHEVVTATSLAPENDASVLYTTAGMQPLIPYLLGQEHPLGKRLVNVQRCVRTGDIEEVGDDYHLTIFEMLGNWSLGDYFKKEAISMSYEFLTAQIGIPSSKLAVTVYKGNEIVPYDAEAVETWLELGLSSNQIFYYGDDENWWGPAGETGPCGPDSEMFYVNDTHDCSENCGPACNCGKYIELGNNVFMTYYKDKEGNLTELEQKNIDVGLGFERLLILANNLQNVYETDLFRPLIKRLEELSGVSYDKINKNSFRIICEHIRASVFILADPQKIVPTNSEQGYILRRLIRRTIRMIYKLGIEENIMLELAEKVIEMYNVAYPEVQSCKNYIIEELSKEYIKFTKTLQSGLKVANKYFDQIKAGEYLSSELAFRLYDTYGFPIEFTLELAQEKEILVDIEGFKTKFEEHQNKSRSGAAGKFKGGLAEHNSNSVRLHTATHLLNSALRKVLGNQVYQKGSHINSERLRFDFSFDRKLLKEEIDQVESLVNKAIQENLEVKYMEMNLDDAKKSGALGVFEGKYEDIVKVYEIPGYSLEICGGPHVSNTSELGYFKVIKEQSSSSGVRRIKAIVNLD